MTDKDRPRLFVTAALFALFAFVLWHNKDNEMLIGALIGAFGTAITFWLGSSKGSSDKASQIEEMSSGPQTVTIDQPKGEPVPVQETKR